MKIERWHKIPWRWKQPVRNIIRYLPVSYVHYWNPHPYAFSQNKRL